MMRTQIKTVALGDGVTARVRMPAPRVFLLPSTVEAWDESCPSEIFPGRIERPITEVEARDLVDLID